jgi:TctA family transporter
MAASPLGPGGNPNGGGVITLTTVRTTLAGISITEEPIVVARFIAVPASASRRSKRGRDDAEEEVGEEEEEEVEASESAAAARASLAPHLL